MDKVSWVLTFERFEPHEQDWQEMDARPDRVIFQTREWLEFIRRSQGAEPVVASIFDGGERVGYFTGLIVKRLGIRILGSPLPGWTTESMGFNLPPSISRRDAAKALKSFAYGPLRCLHFELKDRRMQASDLDGLGFESTATMTYDIDLTGDESTLFGQMSGACRRAIRKAEKSGVQVEVATGVDFAEEYYDQLQDVFGKQSLVPTYGIDRVRHLIRFLEPTGRLLLLRALGPDGRSIASAIFPAFNGRAYFWGGASLRSDQIFRPNEAIFWYAMRHLRQEGTTTLDMGGAGEYKRKYGGREVWLPWSRHSRYPGLSAMRNLAKAAARRRQMRLGARLWQP
jgi:CelD/BcsL family acetyltransferase involved in cellulose biosynthesis